MTTNTNTKLATKRLVTMNGVHCGFVVVDTGSKEICFPVKNEKPFNYSIPCAFARVNDAIICALDKAISAKVAYETMQIGTRYQLQDF